MNIILQYTQKSCATAKSVNEIFILPQHHLLCVGSRQLYPHHRQCCLLPGKKKR